MRRGVAGALKVLPLTPITFMPGARPARSPTMPGTMIDDSSLAVEAEADRIPGRDPASPPLREIRLAAFGGWVE